MARSLDAPTLKSPSVARMIRLLELMESHGANLGPPHTEPMGDGLFEIRAKAQEGIGRGLFCYLKGNEIIVLHAFVKKSQKRRRSFWHHRFLYCPLAKWWSATHK